MGNHTEVITSTIALIFQPFALLPIAISLLDIISYIQYYFPTFQTTVMVGGCTKQGYLQAKAITQTYKLAPQPFIRAFFYLSGPHKKYFCYPSNFKVFNAKTLFENPPQDQISTHEQILTIRVLEKNLKQIFLANKVSKGI